MQKVINWRFKKAVFWINFTPVKSGNFLYKKIRNSQERLKFQINQKYT